MVTEVKQRRHKVSQKCRVCHGVGYREYEGGLVQIPCRRCGGTGKVIKGEKKDGDKVPISAGRTDTDS